MELLPPSFDPDDEFPAIWRVDEMVLQEIARRPEKLRQILAVNLLVGWSTLIGLIGVVVYLSMRALDDPRCVFLAVFVALFALLIEPPNVRLSRDAYYLFIGRDNRITDRIKKKGF